jgi:hypothetical protein
VALVNKIDFLERTAPPLRDTLLLIKAGSCFCRDFSGAQPFICAQKSSSRLLHIDRSLLLQAPILFCQKILIFLFETDKFYVNPDTFIL